MRIAVVPAYNEEDCVARTVRSLTGLGFFDRVFVIDDGSGDLTAREAAAAGATVMVNGRNLGKGGSLNRILGILDFDELLLLDADVAGTASLAGSLVEEVFSGRCDMAIAAFPPPETNGGFGIAQGTGRAVIDALSGRLMASPLSGQRAMTREAFEKVFPFDEGFGMEVGMTLDGLYGGLRIVEVPARMTHRETARSLAGFIHRGRQFKDIVRAALVRTWRSA
jgi:glycosyltransferase involved in cell wall biosynthesis